MSHSLWTWLSRGLSHPAWNWGLAAFSLVSVLASLVFVPRVLARLPRDYLQSPPGPAGHPLLLRVLRNLLGVVLLLLGLAMLLLPGQGLLTLLVGCLLVDFPGKHGLIVRALRRPSVLSIVNKLRERHGAPPLA
jgi:hypothetical protein